MTSIKIYNVTSREAATPMVRLLQGKTDLYLQVVVAPAMGGFDIWVSTPRPDVSEEALRDTVLGVLALCILDLSSAPVLRAIAEGCQTLHDGDNQAHLDLQATDQRLLEHFGLVRRGTQHAPKEDAVEGFVLLEGEARWAWMRETGQWFYAGKFNTAVPPGTVLYADEDCTIEIRRI